ncbi:MAG: LysE family translocator [Pseudomonadota bacterium]
MPSADLLIPFFIASLMFAFFPGPALLYTAAQTLARGRRAGLAAALGIHTGGYVHVLGATLGLSAMLAHVPTAYLALKLFGAAYLVWLGLKMLAPQKRAEPPTVQAKTARRAFVESVAVEVLNPKAALFFIAFLPQFVDPAAAWPVWLQLLTLGTIVNALFTGADIVTVFLTERVVRVVRSSGAGARIARAVGGSALIGLGAHLALSRAQ